MKLRYYLRGLGIGILVTAVIMSISASQNKGMTDEEVKARAKELGMVESTVLVATEAPKTTVTPEPSDKPKPSETPKITATSEPTATLEPSEAPEPTATLEATATPASGNETVTIIIKSGDSSVSVSRSLAEAGLVESAVEYDRYLCNNGYDKTICVGTYEIPVGCTDEEIAKVITKKLLFE